ncbi:MAG TPA: S1 RNA-binding domain-containing protein [Candidatus Bathyarchaeia archaeon]|nr:S1 RNA-binding domain-containing protein [Candidatus Bathyarchaeia archaeon]
MAVDPGVGADREAETMEELLAGIEEDERALRPLRPGEVVEGVVASVSGDEALVDLGGRSAGVLSLREASGEGTDVAVGDRVVAAVVQPEGPDGRVVLSTRRARSRRQWTRMAELAKTGEVVEAEVVEANRGGLVVDVGLRGFVPLSQLASVGSLTAAERGAVPDALRAYVGKRLPLKVIEADQRRDRLILSEKAAAQQLRRRRKEEASSELMEGQVLEGQVASVTTFGVFVDVGAADGLVHRSEITWDKGIEPTTLYHPGDTVRVLVTGVDRERGRISLSIKRLAEDPWERAVRELALGTEVEATVTRVMPYGAFARVPMGIEGLIHVSEIASRRIATPSEVVRPGDLVRVRVVAIEPDRRRLSLSMRQAAGNVVYATRTSQDANV